MSRAVPTDTILQQTIPVLGFRVRVVEGFDAPREAINVVGRVTVGTAEDVTLRLTDRTVSRYHAEFEASELGVTLRDLGSSNGTTFAGTLVREVLLRRDAEVLVGRTKLLVTLGVDPVELTLSERGSFGRLIGTSPAMRAVFATLERAAPTSAPVLITGESGTGKELAARAVHAASPRRDKAFEVVDCGGLPPTLIESELFGHTKGAFTGAHADRVGAFERAHGGTVFLDELGELPTELQPKLLRALGEGEVRRVGAGASRKVDVRVVAATNRDLRREINAGTFRADLFYRLAVVQVRMPALRERLGDLPALVPALLRVITRERGVEADLALGDPLWESLARHAWPGNVRELRNYLEQWAILKDIPPPSPTEAPSADRGDARSDVLEELEGLPLRAAREALLERFDRHYLTRLLRETGGNATEAARRAGIDRVTMFRLLRRLGLTRDEG